jgi:hypothetical protein
MIGVLYQYIISIIISINISTKATINNKSLREIRKLCKQRESGHIYPV